MKTSSKKSKSKKIKKTSFGRRGKLLTALVVILLVGSIGAWKIYYSKAATNPTVRFVYLYAADEALNTNSYAMLGTVAKDVRAFYKAQVGKDINVSSVGAKYRGNLTVGQYRTCPAGADCRFGVQSAIYENLNRNAQLRQPNMITVILTQFNRGDGVNCGQGAYDSSGSGIAGGMIVYATAACQNYLRTLTTASHELGHAFGLSRLGGGHSSDGSLMDASTATTQCDNTWAYCFLNGTDKNHLKASPFFANPPVITGIVAAKKIARGAPGHWTLWSDGEVKAHGAATNFGHLKGKSISGKVIDIASPDTGGGYWIVTSTGAVYSFGSAAYKGGANGKTLNASIVSIESAKGGGGYWLLGADGGIFSYGTAKFYGSTGSMKLNAPIVGMAAHPDGTGYWLVASDGGIFSFSAPFYGSAGGMKLNAPVIDMAVNITGSGYRLVASDGGIFTYGSAAFYGSAVGMLRSGERATGFGVAGDGKGYWIYTNQNRVLKFGSAKNY